MRAPFTMLMALGLLSACAEGREVPAFTQMVEIRNHLTFDFGPERLCMKGSGTNSQPVEPTCEQANSWTGVLYPKVSVKLKPFAIDEHEVTNLQYEYCVAMGKCSEPEYVNAVATAQEFYYGNPQYADYPVVQVDQQQAAEYCFFAGKRLPTEIEWERVAKIDENGQVRHLPTELTNTGKATVDGCANLFNVSPCNGNSRMLERVKSSASDWVETGAGKVHDLGGNVSEWTGSWYAADVTCSGDLPGDCKTHEQCRAAYPAGSTDLAFCLQQAQSAEGDPGYCADCRDLDTTNDPERCWVMCEDSMSANNKALTCSTWRGTVDASELEVQRSTTVALRGANTITTGQELCDLYSWSRNQSRPNTQKGFNVGFRCARDL